MTFNPVTTSEDFYPILVRALKKAGMELDLVMHGKSGIISVFAPGQWRGKADAIADIYPAKDKTWVIEWLDGKTLHGSGGDEPFALVIVQGIQKNMKWVAG
ncbi:hypothetical protein ACFQ14_03685 [Pseudahrensia aquimaris]|uniref:Uncharacterized protein n=1 Tax=Pseudahrensia aquimaris TaxID=744461 RepID=A0ABW3FCH2_9HYPH